MGHWIPTVIGCDDGKGVIVGTGGAAKGFEVQSGVQRQSSGFVYLEQGRVRAGQRPRYGVALRVFCLVLAYGAGMVLGYRSLGLSIDGVQFVDPFDLDSDLQTVRPGRATAVEGKEANLVGVVQTEVDGVFVVRRGYEAEDSFV